MMILMSAIEGIVGCEGNLYLCRVNSDSHFNSHLLVIYNVSDYLLSLLSTFEFTHLCW